MFLTLQGLPAELRHHEYGYFSPVYCHTKECASFLLSCKQFYYEYKAELPKVIRAILASIEREWQSVYDVPLQIVAFEGIGRHST